MTGTNNGGGARWGQMDWGTCPRCGLRHRIGIMQARGEKSLECSKREKCDKRKARLEAKKGN